MPTDFPKKGDDKKISLRNSKYPQFDYSYASALKKDYPKIWRKGGNTRGNGAFENWTKVRDGESTTALENWIKEREAWAARHYENFRLAGVVAQIKWGVIGSRGEGYMKNLINEEKKKDRNLWERIKDYVEKELGIGSKDEKERAMSYSQLAQQVYEKFQQMGMMDYPIDIYMDDNSHYLLTTSGGKLYRYQINFNEGEISFEPRVQVMETHSDVAQTRTIIRETKEGQRWVSISATSVLNRDGEIDSRDLFDSFIEYAEETGKYPVRMFYHAGESFRIGQADFLARDGNCYITSGLFDDSELAQRTIKAIKKNPDYWGESIGYIPTSEPELVEINRGIKIPVYQKGINIEISMLPEEEAANLFTITKGVERMLDERKMKAFVELFEGDEEAAKNWIEENAESRNRQIEEEKMVTREQDEDNQTELTIDDNVIDAIVTRVQSDYQEKFEALKSEIEALKSDLSVARESIVSLQNDNTRLRQVADILKSEYDSKQQERKADTKLTDVKVVYKPRQQETEEKEQLTAAQIAASRLPKGAY